MKANSQLTGSRTITASKSALNIATLAEPIPIAKKFKDTGLMLNNLKKKYFNIDVKILEEDMIDTLKLLDIYNIIFLKGKMKQYKAI